MPRDSHLATTGVHVVKRRAPTSSPQQTRHPQQTPYLQKTSHPQQTPYLQKTSHPEPTWHPQQSPHLSATPRSRRWPTGLTVSASLGAVLLCAAAPAGTELQTRTRAGADPTELALFPTGAWIRPLTCGFNELVADAVWLRALQYYGEHRASDQRYPYLETLFQTLTDLDPRFVNAYIFGALTLAEDEGQLDRGLALLQRGMAANPESWWLVFEYGFLQYIHGDDPARAGYWLARAARMDGSPTWVQRLAAYASAKSGDRETALALWIEVYHNSDNDEIRRIAREYLERLGQPDFSRPAGDSSDASEVPASELDASEVPASELDASEVPAFELDASEVPASELDASEAAPSGSVSPQSRARS